MAADFIRNKIMAKSRKHIIAGIAGGSGSGKTTLVNMLAEIIGLENLSLLHHDSYYKDRSMLDLSERARINYDHPDALETGLLVNHLERLKLGESVEAPLYNFSTHCRETQTITVDPRPLILVEGILVLSDPVLLNYFDLKIFVDLESDLLLSRRIDRDTKERGRTVEASLDQYLTSTRPMFHEYVLPSRKNADMVISGDKSFEKAAVSVIGLGLKSLINGENS